MKKLSRFFLAAILSLAVALPLHSYAFNFGSLVRATTASTSNAKHNNASAAFASMSVTQGTKNPDCASSLPYGLPELQDSRLYQRSFFTCRIGYAGQYDPTTKIPVWIAEHITSSSIEGTANRNGMEFSVDPQIPTNAQASLDDYRSSKGDVRHDRGHLAPAADFKDSPDAMQQSFLLTNIVPQNPEMNRGVWSDLEGMVREMAMRRGELFVVTGPAFHDGKVSNWIGRSRVAVPDAIFKIVADPKRNEMTAFIIPNESISGKDVNSYQVSVRDVEKMTGINFNPSMDRASADRQETNGGNWILPKTRSRNHE